jgi:hypothetical protein
MSVQQIQKPEVKPGEWHDALWHQYMNCIDSLRAQAAESTGIPGIGPSFRSHPSFETFEGNVSILEAMCEGYGFIDDDYRKKVPEGKQVKGQVIFAALTDLLKRKNVWKEARAYLGRI